MLQRIFPEFGWYLYITQQLAGKTEIEGPYSQEESLARLQQRKGDYWLSIYVKHHWRAPEGAIRPIRFKG